MVAVSGELRAAEASGAMAAINTRRQGSRTSYYLFMLALYAGGAVAGFVVGLILKNFGLWAEADPALTTVAGLWVGIIAYPVFVRRWANARFRRRMTDRGLDLDFQHRLEVSEDGLILESAGVRSVAAWHAVTDLFRAKGYWVFLVRTAPWFLPSRFFVDQAVEKAFLRAALEHMTPEARARSQKAETFAKS